jgi:serine/threonine protein kinase
MTGQLMDRYELKGLIGEGAMGSVYRAHDDRLGRIVALKVMNAELGRRAEAVERFKREARVLAGLQHPNIVTIYDYLEVSGNLCLVMELIPGEPLDRVIEQRLAMTVEQKLRFMANVCRALHYAHGRGVVHRDLKPSNILMLPDHSPKIVDFGIAKMMSEKLTRTHTRIGTIAYMSPEQINGDGVDHRADIFSAGVVLFELLSGVSPFGGVHTTATMRKILLDPTPVLPESLTGVPRQVKDILEQALAKDREQRFQAAGEMATALEDAAEAVGRQAKREPLPKAKVKSVAVPLDRPSVPAVENRVRPIEDADHVGPMGHRLYQSSEVQRLFGGAELVASTPNRFRWHVALVVLCTIISPIIMAGILSRLARQFGGCIFLVEGLSLILLFSLLPRKIVEGSTSVLLKRLLPTCAFAAALMGALVFADRYWDSIGGSYRWGRWIFLLQTALECIAIVVVTRRAPERLRHVGVCVLLAVFLGGNFAEKLDWQIPFAFLIALMLTTWQSDRRILSRVLPATLATPAWVFMAVLVWSEKVVSYRNPVYLVALTLLYLAPVGLIWAGFYPPSRQRVIGYTSTLLLMVVATITAIIM